MKAKVKREVRRRQRPDSKAPTFQQLIFELQEFWSDRHCVLQQPYDVEVGAGTMHPETFLRVLGKEPYRVAYVQPSRRPADGRYGENPNRLYKHSQLQVILKPSPADVQDPRSALGVSAGRCCSMDWRSPSSPIFNSVAAWT